MRINKKVRNLVGMAFIAFSSSLLTNATKAQTLDDIPDLVRQELLTPLKLQDETVNAELKQLFELDLNLSGSESETHISVEGTRYVITIWSDDYEKVVIIKKDGTPIVKSIKNQKTTISYWNQYYQNGEFRSIGYTQGYVEQVGKWSTFQESGEFKIFLDKEKVRIPFLTAYETADKLKLTQANLDYSYNYDTDLWQIRDHGAQKVHTLDSTGQLNSTDLSAD